MSHRLSCGRTLPKFSTMPRQKSELVAGVDIYKLLIEKKRLQQELEMMEQRRQQIYQRLAVLENQLVSQTNSIQQQGENPPASGNVPVPAPSPQPANLQSFMLEY
jgi:hypothetical protein